MSLLGVYGVSHKSIQLPQTTTHHKVQSWGIYSLGFQRFKQHFCCIATYLKHTSCAINVFRTSVRSFDPQVSWGSNLLSSARRCGSGGVLWGLIEVCWNTRSTKTVWISWTVWSRRAFNVHRACKSAFPRCWTLVPMRWKKRVAKSLACWKLPDELHRIHQKMESHELWLSFFKHFVCTSFCTSVLYFCKYLAFVQAQTASWGTSGSSCETLPISFWVLGLQDFWVSGTESWRFFVIYHMPQKIYNR